jgi:hypothetical protein
MDELRRDEDAQTITLRVALNYHANMTSLLEKKRKAWWDGIAQQLEVDIEDLHKNGKRMRTTTIEGAVYAVVEDTPKEPAP